MKKSVLISVILLSISFLSGCGNSPSPAGSPNDDAKNVFSSCKQKIDVVKNSISELSMEESGEYTPDKNIKRTNFDYISLDKSTYLSEQNFGLYVFNNAYYAINNGYDKEHVDLETTIYSEVTNELDENTRLYLKENNKTSKFYMSVNKSENDYNFAVDWLGDGESRKGNIYVNGEIKVFNNEVSSFSITSFSEDTYCFVYSAYYDFVNNKFYHLNIIDSNNEGNLNSITEMINKINNGELTTNNLNDYDFSIAIAKGTITKNIHDVNFTGYVRAESDHSGDLTIFNNCFSDVINVTTLKIRSSIDTLDHTNVKEVTFMEEALQYGLDVTKLYITLSGSAIYSYVSRSDFITMCDGVTLQAYQPIFQKAKEKLLLSDNNSVEYNDDEFLITESHKDQLFLGLNTYRVDEIHYQLTDKVEDVTVYFAVKGNDIVNIKTTDIEFIPTDDPSYEQEVKILLSLSRDNITKIQDNIVVPFNEMWSGKYKVRLEITSDSDAVIRSIIEASNGRGELPNAFLTSADKLGQLVRNANSSKLIYNFDSFLNMEGINYSEEELEKFDEKLLESGTHYSEPGRYGLPFTSRDVCLAYDSSYFDGERKEYDIPKTFEELINVSRGLKASHPDDFRPLFIDSDTNFLLSLLLQRGISLTDRNDKPRLVATLAELKDYFNEGLFTTRSIKTDYSIRFFQNSKIAMSISGSDIFKYLENFSNIKVAALPYDNGNQVYSRVNCVSSLSLVKTGNPYATKGAWLFIKELLSNYLVGYSLDNYLTPTLKYNLDEQDVSGFKKDVAKVFNSIRDKYNPEIDLLNDEPYGEVFIQLSQGMSPNEIAERIYSNLSIG